MSMLRLVDQIAADQHARGGPFPVEWAAATYRFGPHRPDDAAPRAAWAAAVQRELRAFESAHRLLADDESREVLRECLRYNMFGWRAVLRRRNTAEYRAAVSALEGPASPFPCVEPGAVVSQGRVLNRYRLVSHGLDLVTTLGFYINDILNEQYTLHRPGVDVRVEAGDVVLDCGACYGDTSLYFASQVGEAGLVFAIECVPENRAVFAENLRANPHLSGRVRVWEDPLGRVDGVPLSLSGTGPGSRVGVGAGPDAMRSRSLDSLCVASGAVPRVDYIKMDIEGAEQDAILGARALILRDAPKLAISVYHRGDDFYRIPATILSIDPSYRLYLDHHTVHGEETDLYAVSPRRVATRGPQPVPQGS